MSPRNVHFCWFGGEKPSHIESCMKTWRDYEPDAEICEWGEENCRCKGRAYFDRAITAHQWAFAADYARLFVLEKFGGVYLDTDIELCGSLNELRKDSLTLGFEKNCVHGGVIACEPHHPLVRRLIEIYDADVDTGDPTREPKSIVSRITDLLMDEWGLRTVFGEVRLRNGIRILPADRLLVDLHNGKCMTVHHYGASWKKSFDADAFVRDVKRYCDWRNAPLGFRVKEKVKMFLQFRLPWIYRILRDRKRR